MTAISKTLILSSALFLSACSTTIKGQTVEWSLIGASAGAAYGYSRSEYKDKNAMMFAAIGAATGALLSIYKQDPDQKISKLNDENLKLKKDLESFTNPKTVYQSPAMFNSKVPDKYKKLIQPGEWRISEIDQWIEDSENRIIHQDKMMELIPPSLKTNSN